MVVSRRVLKLARHPCYRWLHQPAPEADLVGAYRANALIDTHRNNPEFGHRFSADEAKDCGQPMAHRPRQTGPAHATTLRGLRHYLEQDWSADEGTHVFEPPGDIHTLEISPDVSEVASLFHVTGSYIYVDPNSQATDIEDGFTKLTKPRAHYERVDLDAAYADQSGLLHG